MTPDVKSLAAEIEAILRDQIVLRWMGPDTFVEGYEEAAREIAANQSRAFGDGARTVVLPPGWVAVPRHPTKAMKAAAARAVGGSWDLGHEAYAQAIAAAPALPLQPEGERSDA